MLDVAPESAAAVVTGIIDAMGPVASFPRMGRGVPEFGEDELREVIVGNYRIVYVIEEGTVSVVSVFHAAMDVAARLRQRGGQ